MLGLVDCLDGWLLAVTSLVDAVLEDAAAASFGFTYFLDSVVGMAFSSTVPLSSIVSSKDLFRALAYKGV